MIKLEVEYIVINDKMSDEEYENAPFQKFIVTEEMIKYFVLERLNNQLIMDGKNEKDYICEENIFIRKI